jgi:CRP/FNR family transcriptional regulator, cyclic AMP receptor protein
MVNSVLTPTVHMLREVKLLRKFSDDELEELLDMGGVGSCEAHSNIVIEGEPTWGLYLILEGMVGIYKSNKLSGDVYDVAQLRSGSFFGEMSLVDDNPRSATVKALTACQLFYMSKEGFNAFLDRSQERKLRFYECCVHDLVSRLRELDENYVISQYQLWKAAVTGDAA